MIDEEKYEEILSNGLLLDHYFVLCRIKGGVKLSENKRIQGFVNLLTKKGYIDNDGNLTEKSMNIVDETKFISPSKKDENFNTWVKSVHNACEEKIKKMTGKKQVRDKIDGKYYSFLPNIIDLEKVLYKVTSLYKITDFVKIERTIMKYIEECAKADRWFPVLQYYIMKNGFSQLVTDMEVVDDVVEVSNSSTVDRVDPKMLF